MKTALTAFSFTDQPFMTALLTESGSSKTVPLITKETGAGSIGHSEDGSIVIISILNSTDLNTEKTCGSARKFFILITGYCTFFTVITTILEVRAPIAAPVSLSK